MSYWVDTDIKKMELKIPKKEFPLKGDLIVGTEFPKLYLPTDECDEDTNYWAEDSGEFFVWNLQDIHCHSNYNEPIEELKEIILKYGGTLVADCNGEDNEMEYLRIREGKEKSVKIVEED